MCRLIAIKTVNTMALSIFLCLFQQPDIVLTSGMNLNPDFCLDWTPGRVFVKCFFLNALLLQFHLATSGTKVTLLLCSSNYQKKTSCTSHKICWIYLQNFFLTLFEFNRLCLWQLIGHLSRTQCHVCNTIVTSAHVWSHCTADSKPLESQCN